MKVFCECLKYIFCVIAFLTAVINAKAVAAMELSEGLNLDGQKVVSYKMSNVFESDNKVEQSLRVNLKGNISENLVTDLKIDDSLSEKIEKMYFEYNNEKLNMVLGDINVSPVTEFGRSEKKMRGLIANINAFKSNKTGNDKLGKLTLLCSYENGRPEKEIFMGEGRPGPFKLANDKLVVQSERVYIDGELKNRNIDYGIDYENGILTFNEDVALGAEVSVLYSVQTSFENLNRYSFGAFADNKITELGATKVGFIRTEEEKQNSFNDNNAKTEFNLNQDFKLSEKLSTNVEYSRSFKDAVQAYDNSKDGSAVALNTKLAGKHFDTNLKLSNVDSSYSPYHNGYVKPEKKSEFYFDIHPDTDNEIFKNINGSLGFKKSEAAYKTQNLVTADEDKFFGKFLYNFNENISVNTNFQNGDTSNLKDLKISSRSSKFNIENSLSNQKRNGGIDELNSMTFRATTFPVNKNVYFVEYNDSKLKTYSRLKDQNNELNLKVKRKVNEDVSVSYSLIDTNRKNVSEAESSAMENRVMMDYNLNKGLSLSGQVAERSEKRAFAFEPNAGLTGYLLGAKYLPIEFLKILYKREIWDSRMLTRGTDFQKTEDSIKMILAWPDRPYSFEVKNYLKSPEFDFESGAERGRQRTSAAQLNVRAGSKLKLISEINQSVEQNSVNPVTNKAKQEINYKINDDMDFFFNIEREKSLFSNISSTFKLEAKL